MKKLIVALSIVSLTGCAILKEAWNEALNEKYGNPTPVATPTPEPTIEPTATPTPITKLSTPTDVSVIGGNEFFEVSWDSVLNAVEYEVRMGGIPQVKTSNLTYVVSGISNGSQRCFVIRAIDESGELGYPSESVCATATYPEPTSATLKIDTCYPYKVRPCFSQSTQVIMSLDFDKPPSDNFCNYGFKWRVELNSGQWAEINPSQGNPDWANCKNPRDESAKNTYTITSGDNAGKKGYTLMAGISHWNAVKGKDAMFQFNWNTPTTSGKITAEGCGIKAEYDFSIRATANAQGMKNLRQSN